MSSAGGLFAGDRPRQSASVEFGSMLDATKYGSRDTSAVVAGAAAGAATATSAFAKTFNDESKAEYNESFDGESKAEYNDTFTAFKDGLRAAAGGLKMAVDICKDSTLCTAGVGAAACGGAILAAPCVVGAAVGLSSAGPVAGGLFAGAQGAGVATGSVLAATQSFVMAGPSMSAGVAAATAGAAAAMAAFGTPCPKNAESPPEDSGK